MNSTYMTLESDVPPEVGVVTYAISDQGKHHPSRFSVACGNVVQHPTGNETAPWTVQYQVTNTATPRKVFAKGEQIIHDAMATLTVGFVMTADPLSSLSPSLSPDLDSAVDDRPAWFPIEAVAPEESEEAAGEDAGNPLSYSQQSQLQTQWCWAAVTSSMAEYYNDASSATSQCKLANAAFKQSSCCSAGNSAQCNKPYPTHRALQSIGHLAATVASAISFAAVQQEINGARPVAVAIGWHGGGGHAVVISGYATLSGAPFLYVQDPAGVMTGWIGMADFPGSAGYWRRTNTTL
ncbi:papain-like cysteine protease family protein [Pseudoxanthomonas wuyuanensis]